jgi:hypothetical protein
MRAPPRVCDQVQGKNNGTKEASPDRKPRPNACSRRQYVCLGAWLVSKGPTAEDDRENRARSKRKPANDREKDSRRGGPPWWVLVLLHEANATNRGFATPPPGR